MAAACPVYIATFPGWKTATDDQLIEAYRTQGESQREQAVEELFRRHHSRIVSWCWRFTRDREMALDLAQEIFFRAFRNLASYRGECQFSTWLYVIARNLCLSAVQKRASEPVWGARQVLPDLPDSSAASVSTQMEERQIRGRSWDFIRSALNPVELDVLLLHYCQELPLDVVSRRLGLTNKSGAKAYIVSARRKLSAARQAPVTTRRLGAAEQKAVENL